MEEHEGKMLLTEHSCFLLIKKMDLQQPEWQKKKNS